MTRIAPIIRAEGIVAAVASEAIRPDAAHVKIFKFLLNVFLMALFFPGAYTLITAYHGHGVYDSLALRNPLPPFGLRIIDELALTAIIILLIVKGHRISARHHWMLVLVSIYAIVPAVLLAKIMLSGEGDGHTIMAVKNFLYPLFFFYVLSALHEYKLFDYFLRRLNLVIAISIVFSVAHYVYAPYLVFGARLIGTHLNPNIMAWVAFFGLVNSFCLFQRCQYNRWQFFIMSWIAAVGFFMSASLSVNLSAVLWLGSLPVLALWFARRGQLPASFWRRGRTSVIMVYLAVAGALLSTAVLNPLVIKADYLQKYLNISSYVIALSDAEDSSDYRYIDKIGSASVHDRMISYKKMLSISSGKEMLFGSREGTYDLADGSVVNLYFHSGLTGLLPALITFMLPLLFVLRCFLRRGFLAMNALETRTVVAQSVFLATFLVLNFPVHYGFEVPPTNLLVFLCIFIITAGMTPNRVYASVPRQKLASDASRGQAIKGVG